MNNRQWAILVLMALTGGCSAARSEDSQSLNLPSTNASINSTTLPSDIALLALEQIAPTPKLNPPSTQRAGDPPLEALKLYAQARSAQLEKDYSGAVIYLNRALKLDPDSFELNYLLGRIYTSGTVNNDSALLYFLKAEQIKPDDLDLQILIGRQYSIKKEYDKAIAHLRLASLTSEWRERPETASKSDFFLARALQLKGYNTAAIEVYERLLKRLNAGLNPRDDAEAYFLLSQPEVLHIAAGELLEKVNRYPQAAVHYDKALELDPDNIDYLTRRVNLDIHEKNLAHALNIAKTAVISRNADESSVKLLKIVCDEAKVKGGVEGELMRMIESRPMDRFLLFAIADEMSRRGDNDAAEKILSQAVESSRGASVQRLFDFYYSRKKYPEAVHLIIEALAKKPENVEDLDPLWTRLQRVTGPSRVKLQYLLDLKVDPPLEASRLFWASQLARIWNRDSIAHDCLEKAAAIDPPFAPAFRAIANDIGVRKDITAEQRVQLVEKLADRAIAAGRSDLAAELRGRLATRERQPENAMRYLQESYDLGNRSPGLLYYIAGALYDEGKVESAQEILKRLTEDVPCYSDPYEKLIDIYEKDDSFEGDALADGVIAQWRSNDPHNVTLQIHDIGRLVRNNQMELAKKSIESLFESDPENPLVLEAYWSLNRALNKADDSIKKFEEYIAKNPGNRALVSILAQVYVANERKTDAVKLLDNLAIAVADDADELYFAGHLFDLVDQPLRIEQLLQQALKIDPKHAPAANDLGYMWADRGNNLDESEKLIRQAVELEPSNSAFMDSLGWVLYKRGKIEEAKSFLSRAVEIADFPDPIILDHLGDALYRLKETDAAVISWNKALNRIEEMRTTREDILKVRLEINKKLRQHSQNQPVETAPLNP